jgi:hypothetical protein
VTQQEMIYKIIFPEDDDPNYINYGHFTAKNKNSLYKFKAKLDEIQLNAVLIMDGENKNAFFVQVFQSEADDFLKLTTEFNLKQIKMTKCYMNQVKLMFRDYLLTINRKNHRYSMSMEAHKHLQLINRAESF